MASAKYYIEVRDPHITQDGKDVDYKVCIMSTEKLPGSLQDHVYKWRLTKRYSDFQAFDAAIRKHLGWRMEAIKFPPRKLFGSTKPDFVESRRAKLQEYLRAVFGLDGASAFGTHKESKDLRDFIELDQREKYLLRTQSHTSSTMTAATSNGQSKSGGVSHARSTSTSNDSAKPKTIPEANSHEGKSHVLTDGGSSNQSAAYHDPHRATGSNVSTATASSDPVHNTVGDPSGSAVGKQSFAKTETASKHSAPRPSGNGDLLAAIRAGKSLKTAAK